MKTKKFAPHPLLKGHPRHPAQPKPNVMGGKKGGSRPHGVKRGGMPATNLGD